MTVFVGIDIGASFIKSAALDLDNRRLVGRHARQFPSFLTMPNPKWKLISADEVCRQVRQMIDRYASEKPEGVIITGQTGCFGLIQEYKPTVPFISWQDQRCHDKMPGGLFPTGERTYFEILRKLLTDEEICELGELMPCSPIANLHWMTDHRNFESGSMPISLLDYVAWRLTGPAVGGVPRTGRTVAAAHGLYSLRTKQWHSEVIRKLGLENLLWPNIVEDGSVIGNLGSMGIPIYTPVGDHQCSLAGAGLREGEVSINIGTGSQVSRIGDPPDVFEDYQCRPYFDGKHLACITHIPAGRALNGLLRLVREMAGISEESAWEYVTEHVSGRKKTDLRWNLNFWPSNLDETGLYGGGSLVGIMEETLNVADLFTAAFHSMAERYHDAAEELVSVVQGCTTELRLSGGLAHKLPTLCAAIGERFGCKPTLHYDPDESLTGMLACALAWTGREASVQAAAENLRRDA